MYDCLFQIQSTCGNAKQNEYTNWLENGTFYKTFGTVGTMKLTSMDSFQNAVRCWWDSKPVNCGKIFLNHFLDYGWCFTFNPSLSVLSSFHFDESGTLLNTAVIYL